jgi:hypothetical protein
MRNQKAEGTMRAINKRWAILGFLAATLAAGCFRIEEDRSPTYRVVGWKYQIKVVETKSRAAERLIAGVIVDQDMKAENFKLEADFGVTGYQVVPVDTLVAQAYRDSILEVMLANGNYNPAQHAPPTFYQTTDMVADGAAGMRVTFDVRDVSADLHGIDPGDSVGFGGTTQTDLDDGGGLTGYGVEIHPVVPLPESAGLNELLPDLRSGLRINGVVPNPLRGQATVSYTLPRTASVNLDVFDIRGRLVTRLVNECQPAGDHQVAWDGRDQRSVAVPAGVYFTRLDTPQGSATQRVVIAD